MPDAKSAPIVRVVFLLLLCAVAFASHARAGQPLTGRLQSPDTATAPCPSPWVSDPTSSRLMFLPTYDVLPKGTLTCGASDFFLWHVAVCPTSFLQVGVFTWVFPSAPFTFHAVSGGMKIRLWTSRRWRPGLALGVNYTGFSRDTWDGETTNVRALYAVCGWSGSRWETYVGAFPRWAKTFNAGYYSPGSARGTVEVTQATAVGFGLATRLAETAKAIVELWVPGVGINRSWASLLGVRRYSRAASADFGLMLLKPACEQLVAGPILNVSFYF